MRPVFGGPLSYASSPLDGVDRSPFDIVGLDAFRSLRNADTYRDDLREEFAHGKPVAVLEVGCCTFQEAGDLGGAGRYVAMEKDGVTLKPDLVGDEGEQSPLLDSLLPVFEEEGVDSVLWFSFSGYALPHRPHGGGAGSGHGFLRHRQGSRRGPRDPRLGPHVPRRAREPKEAFHALGDR
ncbi:hypothetical protein [Streptomyces sp. I05A-00742]|uniref:hypothetical protein n=1 Tax=Streptomyces sp. I05A-00742 TaxID=2732853 RepID=UPI002017DEB3|nr:hypothetical protein [Streptomyces sp. I05A-00742]